MAVFLSTYVNKVDRKGRVSVPASFRAVLAEQSAGVADGVIVFRSLQHPALEACSERHMEALAEALEKADLDDETRDLWETNVFAGSVLLPIDAEGRVILPQDLAEFAGITENAAFVGRNKVFQIWQPETFRARAEQARTQGRNAGLSLSSLTAAARRTPQP
ncbi:MAG: division/cell wall cluster transcriptional repressor MraZ [Azospirillaceae bacterium]|nr:division/cell wall cluster transcriptional repressor MraZ [Azospirillaceae bacterium]